MRNIFTTLLILATTLSFAQDQVFQKETQAINIGIGFMNDDLYYNTDSDDLPTGRYENRSPVTTIGWEYGTIEADKMFIGFGAEAGIGFGSALNQGNSYGYGNKFIEAHKDNEDVSAFIRNDKLLIKVGNEEFEHNHKRIGTLMHLGVTMSFHLDLWRITKQPVFRKLDIYGMLVGGGMMEKYTITWDEFSHFDYTNEVLPDHTFVDKYSIKNKAEFRPFYGGSVGARFYLSDNFGLMAELGYKTSSMVNFGISFKY